MIGEASAYAETISPREIRKNYCYGTHAGELFATLAHGKRKNKIRQRTGKVGKQRQKTMEISKYGSQ